MKLGLSILILIISQFILTYQPARAHYLSESIYWIENAEPTVKTELGWRLDPTWTVIGSYYSFTNFIYRGGQVALDYYQRTGWQSWLAIMQLNNDVILSAELGHNRIIGWENNTIGLKTGISRSAITLELDDSSSNLVEWRPMVSVDCALGNSWMIGLDGYYYHYTLELRPELIEQYNDLSKDQLIEEFKLFQLGIKTIVLTDRWGSFSLILDGALTYNQSYFVTGQVIWSKSLSKVLDIYLQTQVSSRNEALIGAGVILNF